MLWPLGYPLGTTRRYVVLSMLWPKGYPLGTTPAKRQSRKIVSIMAMGAHLLHAILLKKGVDARKDPRGRPNTKQCYGNFVLAGTQWEA